MRDRITQLEAQLTVTPPSPKDSGFQTPREVPVVNNLIDLDTPPRPRIPKEKIDANDLRSRMVCRRSSLVLSSNIVKSQTTSRGRPGNGLLGP